MNDSKKRLLFSNYLKFVDSIQFFWMQLFSQKIQASGKRFRAADETQLNEFEIYWWKEVYLARLAIGITYSTSLNCVAFV